jgi:hypothetical protein
MFSAHASKRRFIFMRQITQTSKIDLGINVNIPEMFSACGTGARSNSTRPDQNHEKIQFNYESVTDANDPGLLHEGTKNCCENLAC